MPPPPVWRGAPGAESAESAASSRVSYYFSLTKNPGTENESISYYETFNGAYTAAANGDKIMLLKDYTAPGEVEINKSITLDLNGHRLRGAASPYLMAVGEGAVLTIVGNWGEASVTGGKVSATIYGISLAGGTMTIDGDVEVSVPHGTGIFYDAGELTLKALPIFSQGNNAAEIDMNIATGLQIAFGTASAGSYEAPENPIVINFANEPPYTFTSGYSTNVRDAQDNVIDPSRIFVAYRQTDGYVIEFNEDMSEAIVNSNPNAFSLSDNADNSGEIILNRCGTVTLAGRTITRDGMWNTLCLPFDVTLSGSPLDGFTVKELNASGDACQFVGQYSPFEINDGTASEDHNPEVDNIDEILFLGTNATTHSTVLGYLKSPRTLRACRAHFYVPATQGANGVRSINLNFGDGETTGIKVITDPTPDPTPAGAESWYTIDGRRLDSAPTVKGVYIHNGQKIVVR